MVSSVKIFKALSDTNRLRILKALQARTLCVCEIREFLKLANSTVSEHLKILKDAGFIIEEKDGKWVNYSINPHSSDKRINAILVKFDFWTDEDESLTLDKKLIKSLDRDVLCCRT